MVSPSAKPGAIGDRAARHDQQLSALCFTGMTGAWKGRRSMRPPGGERRARRHSSTATAPGAVHFLADYEPIAERVIFAAAPGANPCALSEIPYTRLRPGLRLGPCGPAIAPRR